jgi:hypothetical protein
MARDMEKRERMNAEGTEQANCGEEGSPPPIPELQCRGQNSKRRGLKEDDKPYLLWGLKQQTCAKVQAIHPQ